MAVTILKTSTVVPSKPTERQLMYLSSIDIFYRTVHYNLRVLFYEQIKPWEVSGFVSTLKESLAEVLVPFYPLAGRLAEDQDDGGRLVIDCNDAGVEFMEAQTAASFKELQDAHFDFTPLFSELAPFGHLTRSDVPHLPLLAVQVTQFLEGGIALAISHSHIAMDGPSLWQFWVSWGERARGLPLTKPPVHTRAVFKPDKISHELAKLIPAEMTRMQISESGVPLVNKVMHFSTEAMGKLKDMGIDAESKVEGPKRRVSSLEVLFAHCWRHVTRARMLPDEQELSFIVLADARRTRSHTNIPPPVPENFFGNAITWTCAKATPHILCNETFAATLARIAQVVDDCVHPNNLRGMIHCFEIFGTLEPLWFSGVNINVASSPRFPTHLVDFGWGPPTCARPIRAGGDGELCLFPCFSGGVDVCIKLDASSLQHLIDDPEFLCPSP